MLKKVKKRNDLGHHVSAESEIIFQSALQKTIDDSLKSHVTRIEGFFILKSSVNDAPEKIIKTYKKRDNADKIFRDLKEGAEMHPVQH